MIEPSQTRRIERALLERMRSAYEHLALMPGNPLGAEVHPVGAAVGFFVRALAALPWHHRILGLTAAELHNLDALLEPFDRAQVRARVEVWPSDEAPLIEAELNRRGFRPEMASAALFRPTSLPLVAHSEAVEVHEATHDDDRELAVQLMIRAFPIAPESEAMFRRDHELPGLRMFLARIEGVPVAAAACTRHVGVGYLADAATLPTARGRGAQSALVNRRLEVAREDCDLVAVTTAVQSPSRRNLERLGFQLLHERMRWVRPS